MGYLRFLIPFLLFFQVGDGLGVHTRSVDGMNIHTRPVRKQLREGESIELPCTIIGAGYNPFTNPIVWYKVVGHTELQINTGSVISEPFLGTGRYRIQYKQEMEPVSKVSAGLMLTDMTLAESGTYRCELLAPPDQVLANVTHSITMVAPVDSLEFTSNNTQTITPSDNTTKQQMTFDFVELMPSYVSCIARGGTPKPTLKIYQEKADITKDFTLEIQEEKTGVPGLEVTSYTVSLIKTDYWVRIRARGEHLKCVAKIHKAQDLKRSQTALIEVKYLPRFTCDSPRAWPGDVNVTLSCHLSANPPVQVTSIRWYFSIPKDNYTMDDITLEDGSTSADGGYTASTEVDDSGDVTATLTIHNVTAESFNTYRLEAVNDIGTKDVVTFLEEAFTTVEPTTLEVTTEIVTTRAPKDTILPEKDENKQAASVTGGATSRKCSLALGVWTLALTLFLLGTSSGQSRF